ncbi:MAG: hypothetical protein JJ902_03935 [Roseibium sp.]|nr:hypothetical protein [Roseibium sp.]
MLHDFKQSLAKSHEQESAPWWQEVYQAAFPAFKTMHSVRCDGWAQRGGIDRVVCLSSGKQVLVDEKVRYSVWPDIAIERWSDRDKRTPGWVQKDLACDYIAYAFVPTKRCYLLPFLNLRAAWINNGRDWIRRAEQGKDGFKIVIAPNSGYDTESIAVPIEILLTAIQDSMKVEWRS